ncbi:MAG: flagellar basal body P-ring protein FlgI [Myxococcota bacterium]|nr:flagellar basal body P-ring protein FlgI [Myxococcota bacterium]
MTAVRRSALGLVLALALAAPAGAVRIKELASVKGVRDNQIIGYGLVVGLNGTGDKNRTEFTIRSLTSLLGRMGIGVDPRLVQVRNVAAVMVTSNLHPFAKTGTEIDAVVSSLGDATSLEGGTLLMTPLYGADGEVYAIAQGPISVGGFSAAGGGSSVQKNHPTAGRIAGGATVEREVGYTIEDRTYFDMSLHHADFTTAQRVAKAINRTFDGPFARARDGATLEVDVPESLQGDVVGFLARLEAIEVEPDRIARVVLNERTGTVVMGADVRIGRVAVSHGNLSVTISATTEVSQPYPVNTTADLTDVTAVGGGRTAEFTNVDVETIEEGGGLQVVGGDTTVDELVRGLNAMGVTPRDLIAILQAVRAAGALSADLEIL